MTKKEVSKLNLDEVSRICREQYSSVNNYFVCVGKNSLSEEEISFLDQQTRNDDEKFFAEILEDQERTSKQNFDKLRLQFFCAKKRCSNNNTYCIIFTNTTILTNLIPINHN